MKTNQLNSFLTTALIVLAALFSTQTKAQDFAGGTGDPGDPYQVATAEHLNNVRNYLSSHFIQTADIDLDISPYNEGNGWEPIGTSANKFSGSYNGQQYKISNLFIDMASTNYIGLFGYLAGEAELLNIGLEDVNIIGQTYVGAIAGRSDGTISQSYSSGIISATSYVGGITGYNYGSGSSNAGLIINCYSLAYVEGTASTKRAGGITGRNYYATIENCYAAGGVAAGTYTGGLAGDQTSSQEINSFWNIETSAQLSTAGDGTGITITQMMSGSTFTDAGWDFTNIWNINEGESYPWLRTNQQTPAPKAVPKEISTIQELDDIRNFLHGHFLLVNDLDFEDDDSYSKETGWETYKASMLSGDGFNPIGDGSAYFTGLFDGDVYAIKNMYINRPSTDYIGLFGYVGGAGEVRNTGLENVNIEGKNDVGALAGRNDGTISASYSTGILAGYQYIGGIAGQNYGITSARIGIIRYSYSLASVEASNSRAGGITGRNYYSTIENCYAAGGVADGSNTGGIAGDQTSSPVINSFWNIETSAQLSTAGDGTSITITQMMSGFTFTDAGWDFTNIWNINEGESYPWLRTNQQTPAPKAVPIEISTIQELDDIRNFLHGHFLLVNDLDFGDDDSYSKETGWETYKASMMSGDGFNPIGDGSAYFTGLFDGDVYAIKNMYINRPATDYIGLFGYVGGAGELRNTGLENVNIEGKTYVGALVGQNDGTISASYSTGILSGYQYIGGIAGQNYGITAARIGIICYSYSLASVEASNSRAGGITGRNYYSTIENCYAAGGVADGSNTGGIVGDQTSSPVINSFWNIETSGQSTSAGGGEGITTWEMMTKSTFEDAGWNFDNVWNILEEESYPWLIANPQAPPPAPVPVEITTIQQLNDVRNFLHGHFKLMNNLDFSDENSYSKETGWEDFMAQMTTGSGFEPIGTNANPFTGLFDGNGFIINNLHIQRPDEDYIGLFGMYNSAGSIKKLGFLNANIAGKDYVGIITGQNEASIQECFTSGNVSANNYAGGITGQNYGIGSTRIGMIRNSYSLASVEANNGRAGGITGRNYYAAIENCYAAGVVAGGIYTGGITGEQTSSQVVGSFWNIETSGQNSTAGGGAGIQTWRMMISTTYEAGGWDFDNVWGIDEYNSYPWLQNIQQIPAPPFPVEIYTIQDLYNISDNLSGYYKLMNNLDFDENTSYAQEEGWEDFKAAMTGGDGFVPIGDDVAPFTGFFDGNGLTISNLYIDRSDTDYVGLFGNITNLGSVKNLGVLDADVTGKDYVGVIAGQSRVTISACYSSGSASGVNEVGGIAGRIDGHSSAQKAYLVNCYSFAGATATVGRAGGLAGYNRNAGTSNCYAAGLVNAPSSAGGLVGAGTGSTVNNSYWNTQTTNQLTSAGGGEGKTTLEMTYPYDPNTYDLWNFLNIWAADTDSDVNAGYPYLAFPGSYYANTLVIPDGGSNCYDLEPIIIIAGDGTGVILEGGSSLEVSATESVKLLDGTIIKQGAYFKAWISDEAYCTVEKSLLSAENNNAIIPEMIDDSKNREISFHIFPNPTTGSFTLELNELDEFSVITVEISNMVGERIIRQEMPAAAQYRIDLSRYHPGIYLVRVIQGKEAGVLKVVKK